ncbi:MAG: hypothetical protein KDK90_11380 [Leptospiraceae bacterium]|nr:hypothetical protein [Leptospiraceae bacterium]
MKSILIIFLFFVFCSCLISETKKTNKDCDKVEIIGKLSVVGNEPFTQLILRSEKGNYIVENDKDFRTLQNQIVNLTGCLTIKKQPGGIIGSIFVESLSKM